MIATIYELCIWVIASVNMCAMSRICKLTKSLEKFGLFTSQKIMTTYVICFVCYALSITVAIVLALIVWLATEKNVSTIEASPENLAIAETVALVLS